MTRLRLAAMSWILLGAVALAEESPRESGRGFVVLRLDCRSSIGRWEVTLFGNGTVRLREGPPGREKMTLGELGRAETEAVLARLGEIDLHAAASMHDSASGDWVERCDLEITLPGAQRRQFAFARYDSLGLGLDQVRRIAVELGSGVDPRGRSERLPREYRPKVGDCLLRVDGTKFQVRGASSDGKGLELAGTDSPLTIYIPRSLLELEFTSKVACR